MTEQNFLTGICPHCGNPLQIPGHLNDFSCLYCGKRLTPQDIAPPEAEDNSLSLAQRKALFQELERELPPAVTDHLNIFKHFTKKAYPKYFAKYAEKYGNAFSKLARLCTGKEGKIEAENLGKAVVSRLDQWAEENRGALRSKASLLDEIKYTLCLLTVPAILQQPEKDCALFAEALHEAWVTKYPENTFQAVSYDTLMEGFRPRKLCYITTATCRQAEKPDNCPELTAFRNFRDSYLTGLPDGPEQIEAYYNVAPGICMAIDLCNDPDGVYPKLWEKHLQPCYEALCRGDEESCHGLYAEMVKELSSPEGIGKLLS